MPFNLATIDGRAALVHADWWYDLERHSAGRFGSDPMAALEQPDELANLQATLTVDAADGRIDEVTLGPPVPRPRNCYGIGLNYRAHAAESAMEVPERPLVFTKFPSCLAGPTADVEMRTDSCDYEGELVVVIGPGGRDIDPAAAWDHVVGLMVGQDISDRSVQFHATPPHFDLGKSFDTFGPTGPWLVSVDSVASVPDLRIETRVNGEVRQNDTVDRLIFGVPTLIAYLSRITTLATGDLIFTGTPEGIGAAQGLFLADGDVVETTIDGIGTLRNRCVRIADL